MILPHWKKWTATLLPDRAQWKEEKRRPICGAASYGCVEIFFVAKTAHL
jgi:hypothetical protein